MVGTIEKAIVNTPFALILSDDVACGLYTTIYDYILKYLKCQYKWGGGEGKKRKTAPRDLKGPGGLFSLKIQGRRA
jgi:hypothetical protein